MNENIKGLWWKAQMGYNNQNCDIEVLEKFVELIIKECIDICKDTEGEENSMACCGRQDCAAEIMDRFGINS